MGEFKNLEILQRCNMRFYKLTIIFIGMLIGMSSEGYAMYNFYDDAQECPYESSDFISSFVKYNNQSGKCNPKVFTSRKDLYLKEIKELKKMKKNFGTLSFRMETNKEFDKLWEMVGCVDGRADLNHKQNNAIRKSLTNSVRDLGGLMKKQTNNFETTFADQTLGMLFKLDPTGVTEYGYGLMKGAIADIEAYNYNLTVSEIINKYPYGTPPRNMSCDHIKEAYVLGKGKRVLSKKLIDNSIDRLIQKYENTKYQSEKYTNNGGFKYFKFKCEKNGKDGNITGIPVMLTSTNQSNKRYYSGAITKKYSCDFDQSVNLKSNKSVCEHGFFPRASKKDEISQASFMNVCMRNATLDDYDWKSACDYSYQMLDKHNVSASVYLARKAHELIYSISNVIATDKASARKDMELDFPSDFQHAIKNDPDRGNKQIIFTCEKLVEDKLNDCDKSSVLNQRSILTDAIESYLGIK